MKKVKILIYIFLFIVIVIGIVGSYFVYTEIFTPVKEVKYPTAIYIPRHSTIKEVADTLSHHNLIKNKKIFYWLADKKNYSKKIIPGKYIISKPISINNLINILRSGKQTPVYIQFNHGIKDTETLAKKLAKNIEDSPKDFIKSFNNQAFIDSLGFNKNTILSMFIPNTYEVYWSTPARKVLLRLKKEYQKFWNKQRLQKAKSIKLTPIQVSILASIICKETNKDDEKPIIAGVYINRLRKGIPLQADPTIIFANKAWLAKRVTTKMLKVNSPYNTYKHKGLPPGPICIPDIASIDAVLNYKKHNYLYFCAKSDFSGYHAFATTLSQHLQNAKKYQQALNRMKIYK